LEAIAVSSSTLSLVILGCSVALFIWNRLSVGVVAILTTMALYFTGVLDATTALSGFGDPVVIFIASLFVVSEGLEASGVTAWAGQLIVRHAGTQRWKLLTAVMLLAAVLSAVITPNGAAAALLPVTVVVARQAHALPSKMLIPLAFAASAGALLTLSGSPVNVIVSGASMDAGGGGFGFFEFAIVGIPLVVCTIVLALVLGNRLLPDRISDVLPADFSEYVGTVVEHYGLDHPVHRLRVRSRSPLRDRQISELPVGADLTLIGVQDGAGESVGFDHELQAGDVLVLTGPGAVVSDYAAANTLKLSKSLITRRTRTAMLTREAGVAEFVVPPRSALIGTTMFPGMARSGGLVVLAVRRLGKDRGPRATVITEGDTVLMHGRWTAVESLARSRDLLVVDSPEMVRRQTVPLGRRAPQAIAVLLAMVVLLATGVVPPAIAGLLAATAMVALRVVGVEQAYRAVSWQTVVLIGGLIPLSIAIQTSGAADLIAEVIVGLVGERGPYVLLLALFGLTAALGQVVSNTATVLIVVPIALSTAAETGISPQAVLMLVAVAGAASLLTPIATPANMMVMGPGGYRFGDYWKFGLVTMLVWLAVAMLVIPLVWPFA
jgi:di/tricarboxylate transporter